LHEKIHMETEEMKNKKSDEAATARKKNVAPATEAASSEDFPSELSAPHWSVVSFESRIASNLTYDEAIKKLNQLKAKKVSGLCIVTDEAAKKIKN